MGVRMEASLSARAFFREVLDSLGEQIAVLDDAGVIVFVNRAWADFGAANGLPADYAMLGACYLDKCRGDAVARKAERGIRRLLAAPEAPPFTLEYPCHAPDVQRWFVLRAKVFVCEGRRFVVIAHHDITLRKRAEDELAQLSFHDGLTGLFNRRYFGRFLAQEWRRCQRKTLPLSVLALDLDHFKAINDRFGHPTGDACLREVAAIIARYARRPGDAAVRLGGEEFCMVLADTPGERAYALAERLRSEIAAQVWQPGLVLTVSIGVASVVPAAGVSSHALLGAADAALYRAKASGRNCVFASAPRDLRR